MCWHFGCRHHSIVLATLTLYGDTVSFCSCKSKPFPYFQFALFRLLPQVRGKGPGYGGVMTLAKTPQAGSTKHCSITCHLPGTCTLASMPVLYLHQHTSCSAPSMPCGVLAISGCMLLANRVAYTCMRCSTRDNLTT